jgi:FixJ family two-component response regulator
MRSFANVPDIAIVDLRLPGMNGLAAIKEIRAQAPDVGIIGFTMYDSPAYVHESINLGARGYVLKSASKSDLLRAVRAVFNDGTYFPTEITKPLLSRLVQQSSAGNETSVLTPRELQVLEFLAEGRSSKEIANFLAISEATVQRSPEESLRQARRIGPSACGCHRVASTHHRLNQRPVKPSISLVIPAYNEEVLLPRLLRSVRTACDVFAAWSGGSVEVIVADNASTDRTAEVAAEFGAEWSQWSAGSSRRRETAGRELLRRRCVLLASSTRRNIWLQRSKARWRRCPVTARPAQIWKVPRQDCPSEYRRRCGRFNEKVGHARRLAYVLHAVLANHSTPFDERRSSRLLVQGTLERHRTPSERRGPLPPNEP